MMKAEIKIIDFGLSKILLSSKGFATSLVGTPIYENPKINMILYKISLLLRNIILCIYGLIMLFERPWFCCNGTTISLSSRFNFIEDCEKDVVFSDMPFINDDAIRTLELLFTLTLIITQIINLIFLFNLLYEFVDVSIASSEKAS